MDCTLASVQDTTTHTLEGTYSTVHVPPFGLEPSLDQRGSPCVRSSEDEKRFRPTANFPGIVLLHLPTVLAAVFVLVHAVHPQGRRCTKGIARLVAHLHLPSFDAVSAGDNPGSVRAIQELSALLQPVLDKVSL